MALLDYDLHEFLLALLKNELAVVEVSLCYSVLLIGDLLAVDPAPPPWIVL